MGLTRLAVYRPLVLLVAVATIVMFGVVSYTRLGLDQVPEIKIPIVTVLAPYPGAGPREVEEQVTRKIEDAAAGLSDVEEITSVSSQNLSTVSIQFRESVNVDLVALDVERTVNNLRRELPTEVDAPTVRKVDLNDQPILYLALVSQGSRDPSELFRIADDQVRRRLETLEGISAARVLGGRRPEVEVALDPDRLRAFRLSVSDVTQAITSQYQTASGGTVRGGVIDADREFAVRIEGRERDVSALGNLTISGRDGASTDLRSLADISATGAEQSAIVRLNGRDAIGLLVSKQGQANITQAADRVLAQIAATNATLPPDLSLETIIDRSEFIRDSVRDVQKELGVAALLTGGVLLLFLHTIRATIIVLVAIPTCILATFIVMQLSGLTLNILSLLGLTTSIGILVDDSIVVLENIFRKLEDGHEPRVAAVEGRGEIGLAAIAITLVDVVVYGPIIFVTGTTGGFLRNFAIVVAAATLASLLVSFTLTPMLASRWLKAGGKPSLLSRAAASWEPLYRLSERGYGRFLDWALGRWWHKLAIVLAAIALLVSSGVFLVPLIGTEFVPDLDSPFITINGEMPGGSTLAATDRAARLWEQRLLDKTYFPEIHRVFMTVGAGSTELERGSRFISVIAELEPRDVRSRTSSQVRREALRASNGIAGLSSSIGGNRPGGTGQAIQVRLVGRDIDELSRTAEQVRERLATRTELADVTNSTGALAPQVTLRVDQERLRDLGLSTQQVGNAVRIAYQGIVPAKWPRPDGTEVDIRVRLPEAARRDVDALQNLPLVSSRGSVVTLGQVAELERQSIPARINRFKRQRIAVIGADPQGVPLGSASSVVTQELGAMALPSGVRWELAGQSQEQQESFTNLAIALGISVLLVYLVLTALYESLILPLTVLVSLPLAIIGALAGLIVFKNTLNILSLIGVIALFGLVGKNAILLVDYTNILRRRGMPREQALRTAGPARLRPIIMTSATLIFSLLPVAIAPGEGGELRAPLAAVIIGGMLSSTLLTLVFVPVVYTYFDTFQNLLLHPRLALSRGGREPRPAPEVATTYANGRSPRPRPTLAAANGTRPASVLAGRDGHPPAGSGASTDGSGDPRSPRRSGARQ